MAESKLSLNCFLCDWLRVKHSGWIVRGGDRSEEGNRDGSRGRLTPIGMRSMRVGLTKECPSFESKKICAKSEK